MVSTRSGSPTAACASADARQKKTHSVAALAQPESRAQPPIRNARERSELLEVADREFIIRDVFARLYAVEHEVRLVAMRVIHHL